MELDVDTRAPVTTLVIKHAFGPRKMEEQPLLGLWLVVLLLFLCLHNPLKVLMSLPQCQTYHGAVVSYQASHPLSRKACHLRGPECVWAQLSTSWSTCSHHASQSL